MARRIGAAALVSALVAGQGCGRSQPLGVYRLPVPTGPGAVALRTVLAQVSGSELVLSSGIDGTPFARGSADIGWDGEPRTPFSLSGPGASRLRVSLRDGVMQDVDPRPYAVAPQPPVDDTADSVTRWRLVSGAVERTLVQAGAELFAESPEAQPASGSTPVPLEVLGSVAGAGMDLPAQVGAGFVWKDALSTAVPPSPSLALPCAAPLVAALRSTPGETVQVAAGTFTAVRVVEVVDACPGAAPVALRVFRIDRWFAPGVGPVRIFLTPSDGQIRDYGLVSSVLQGGGGGLWPMAPGNVWTFEARGPDRKTIGAPMEVRVESATTVSPGG